MQLWAMLFYDLVVVVLFSTITPRFSTAMYRSFVSSVFTPLQILTVAVIMIFVFATYQVHPQTLNPKPISYTPNPKLETLILKPTS